MNQYIFTGQFIVIFIAFLTWKKENHLRDDDSFIHFLTGRTLNY